MAGRHRRRRIRNVFIGGGLAAIMLGVVFLAVIASTSLLEKNMAVEVEHAGMQMTSHTRGLDHAQVYMNDRWYAERNVRALLVMGIDELGALTDSGSYNNSNQTDFLMLFLEDEDTGRTAAIHLNRDTMTEITTLGVAGQPTGTRFAQLALAYHYGSGDPLSSSNVVKAVEHLLYGITIDHYITLTMDAIPVLNDWAGGVTVEMMDDFSDKYDAMAQGELVKLEGEQALYYVRARVGLDDSTNLHRMERQRQYAAEWVMSARGQLSDIQSVTELLMQLDGYYRTDCTAEELKVYGQSLGSGLIPTYEIEGEAVRGENYMEFYVDEEALQQLVLELFYAPVE